MKQKTTLSQFVYCRCCGKKILSRNAGRFPIGGSVCTQCYDIALQPPPPQAAKLYAMLYAPAFLAWAWHNLSLHEKYSVKQYGYNALDTEIWQQLAQDFLDDAFYKEEFLLLWLAMQHDNIAKRIDC